MSSAINSLPAHRFNANTFNSALTQLQQQTESAVGPCTEIMLITYLMVQTWRRAAHVGQLWQYISRCDIKLSRHFRHSLYGKQKKIFPQLQVPLVMFVGPLGDLCIYNCSQSGMGIKVYFQPKLILVLDRLGKGQNPMCFFIAVYVSAGKIYPYPIFPEDHYYKDRK